MNFSSSFINPVRFLSFPFMLSFINPPTVTLSQHPSIATKFQGLERYFNKLLTRFRDYCKIILVCQSALMYCEYVMAMGNV